MNLLPRFGTRRKASFLAVTLVIAITVTVVGASYIQLTTSGNTLTEANLSHHHLLYIGERGLDQAMHTLNQYAKRNINAATGNWTGTDESMWIADGWTPVQNLSVYTKAFTDTENTDGDNNPATFDVGNGRRAKLTVKVANLPSLTNPYTAPYIVAKVNYYGRGDTPLYDRQFLIWLKRGSSNNAQMAAKNTIVFTSGFTFRGYYSSKSANGAYVPGINDSSLGMIATPSTAVDPILGGNGDISGYLVTGGVMLDSNAFKPGAHVYDGSNKSLSYAYLGSGIDPARLNNNFADQLPTPVAPAIPSGYTSVKTALAANNNANQLASGTYVLDDTSLAKLPAITVPAGAKVTLIVKPGYAIGGAGQNGITMGAGATMTIYTPGDVDLTGNAFVNSVSNRPASFKIYGTNPTPLGQSIKIAGNAAFVGIINAPNADVKIAGNGVVYGSIIGYNITGAGSNVTVYGDLDTNTATAPKYSLNYWVELKGANPLKI